MKTKQDLRPLLIQIRQNPEVKKEELSSFSNFSEIPLENFTSFDVFEEDFKRLRDLNQFDCVFIGGASEASVSDEINFPFVPALRELVKKLIALKIPTFASCFGFQIAVQGLGGTIIKDTINFEMGTYPIELTEKAKQDPIYHSIPSPFYAVSVHQEKAINLPENCELLAKTPECIHSFKVKDSPFWAFQFHPELDLATLRQRLNIYKEKYTEDRDHFAQVIDSLVETPHSNKLVSYFVLNLLK